jgi:hypothetical protein
MAEASPRTVEELALTILVSLATGMPRRWGMVVLRIIATMGAATAVATAIIVLSGFAPTVDASPNSSAIKSPAIESPAIKGDRLDINLRGPACSERGWPYFEFGCMYDRTAPDGQVRDGQVRDGQVRTVRVISADRLPADIRADIQPATSGIVD